MKLWEAMQKLSENVEALCKRMDSVERKISALKKTDKTESK